MERKSLSIKRYQFIYTLDFDKHMVSRKRAGRCIGYGRSTRRRNFNRRERQQCIQNSKFESIIWHMDDEFDRYCRERFPFRYVSLPNSKSCQSGNCQFFKSFGWHKLPATSFNRLEFLDKFRQFFHSDKFLYDLFQLLECFRLESAIFPIALT